MAGALGRACGGALTSLFLFFKDMFGKRHLLNIRPPLITSRQAGWKPLCDLNQVISEPCGWARASCAALAFTRDPPSPSGCQFSELCALPAAT